MSHSIDFDSWPTRSGLEEEEETLQEYEEHQSRNTEGRSVQSQSVDIAASRSHFRSRNASSSRSWWWSNASDAQDLLEFFSRVLPARFCSSAILLDWKQSQFDDRFDDHLLLFLVFLTRVKVDRQEIKTAFQLDNHQRSLWASLLEWKNCNNLYSIKQAVHLPR